MFWEEDKKAEIPVVTDEVVDIVFGIDCRCLPVDHAYALAEAVKSVLPWLEDEPGAGLHTIHGAASGNGWMRPGDADALLLFSRRTRFSLRVPKHRIEDAKKLQGQRLSVAGYDLTLKEASERPLSTLTTLFARHLAADEGYSSEEELLHWVATELQKLDIRPRKMLCGTEHVISTPTGGIPTRSLMIAELEHDESLRLQQHGIGPHRTLGCGLFIPHKGIAPVGQEKD